MRQTKRKKAATTTIVGMATAVATTITPKQMAPVKIAAKLFYVEINGDLNFNQCEMKF